MSRHHPHHRPGPYPHPGPPPGPYAPHAGPLGYPEPHGPHSEPHSPRWPPPPLPPPPHHAHWPDPEPHGAHGPHAHTWFYNDERNMSLADIATRHQTIATQLIAGYPIDLDGVTVKLPERVQATLRHEQHGDLALKFDLKWFDGRAALYPPHHPPHHHSVFSYEGELTLREAGELLNSLGTQIAERGTVTFDEHTISLPAEALMVVRYERGPLGDLVFKNEVIWREQEITRIQRSIVALVSSMRATSELAATGSDCGQPSENRSGSTP
jgi:hypothetical protein